MPPTGPMSSGPKPPSGVSWDIKNPTGGMEHFKSKRHNVGPWLCPCSGRATATKGVAQCIHKCNTLSSQLGIVLHMELAMGGCAHPSNNHSCFADAPGSMEIQASVSLIVSGPFTAASLVGLARNSSAEGGGENGGSSNRNGPHADPKQTSRGARTDPERTPRGP